MEVWNCPSLSIDRRNRSVALCRVFDLKFNGIQLAKVILKLWVVNGRNIVDVPVCEIDKSNEFTDTS